MVYCENYPVFTLSSQPTLKKAKVEMEPILPLKEDLTAQTDVVVETGPVQYDQKGILCISCPFLLIAIKKEIYINIDDACIPQYVCCLVHFLIFIFDPEQDLVRNFEKKKT